jgi:hypothetical protein
MAFDPRTKKGETMHRASRPACSRQAHKLPGYEGQYNQQPDRQAAGIFERRFARFFVFEGENSALRRRPNGCPDTRASSHPSSSSSSELDADHAQRRRREQPRSEAGREGVAGRSDVGGCRGEETYVLDDHTKVLGISATYRAIFELIALWMLERVLVEKKAMGPSVIAELERAIRRGWYLDPDTDERIELLGPDGKRVRPVIERSTRARTASPARARHASRRGSRGYLLPRRRVVATRTGRRSIPQVDANRKTVDEGCP